MAVYKLSTLYKKSTVERTYYSKDDRFIVREEGWRWGTYTGEFEAHPDIDLTQDLEISCEDDWEMDSLEDGCWMDWEFPDDMSEEEREQIQAAYDEEWDSGLEELGWVNDEYECWLQAPLRLESEDGTVWTGDDEEQVVTESGRSSNKQDESGLALATGGIVPTAAWPFPTARPPEDSPVQDSDSGSGSSE